MQKKKLFDRFYRLWNINISSSIKQYMSVKNMFLVKIRTLVITILACYVPLLNLHIKLFKNQSHFNTYTYVY